MNTVTEKPAAEQPEEDIWSGVMADLAHEIFDAAFDKPREPRSAAYKSGVLYALLRSAGVYKKAQVSPYAPGTAEADAFWAGADEGRTLWAIHREKISQPTHPLTREINDAYCYYT